MDINSIKVGSKWKRVLQRGPFELGEIISVTQVNNDVIRYTKDRSQPFVNFLERFSPCIEDEPHLNTLQYVTFWKTKFEDGYELESAFADKHYKEECWYPVRGKANFEHKKGAVLFRYKKYPKQKSLENITGYVHDYNIEQILYKNKEEQKEAVKLNIKQMVTDHPHGDLRYGVQRGATRTVPLHEPRIVPWEQIKKRCTETVYENKLTNTFATVSDSVGHISNIVDTLVNAYDLTGVRPIDGQQILNTKENNMKETNITIEVNGEKIDLCKNEAAACLKPKTDFEARKKYTIVIFTTTGQYSETVHVNAKNDTKATAKMIAMLQKPENLGKTAVLSKEITAMTTDIPVVKIDG